MKGYLTGIALIVVIIAYFIISNQQTNSDILGSIASIQRLSSPGKLSSSHSHLKSDCNACHTSVKGPSPEKCMTCHAANENLSVWPELSFHLTVPDCKGCHTEHTGMAEEGTKMNHDVYAKMVHKKLAKAEFSSASKEDLQCATCHKRSDAHSNMFGQQCSSCHNTLAWTIPKFRHPPSESRMCAQCHRAPPCHFTSHFKKVCAPVAGQSNATVSECHSCHQLPSWNSIKSVGWYKSH